MRVLAILVAVLAVAACAADVPATNETPGRDASPGATAPGTPTASPSPSPEPADAVPIDPALLDHLPPTVEGLVPERADEGLGEALADPAIGASATAAAAALAVDPAGSDLVYAALIRLRPGVMTDAFYRDWRDSFDEGACSQAGGVAGHAEAEIGGRRTYIGSCAGGLRTYHVWLGNSGVLASVWSVGERRLGERLVEGLTD